MRWFWLWTEGRLSVEARPRSKFSAGTLMYNAKAEFAKEPTGIALKPAIDARPADADVNSSDSGW